MSVSQVVEDVGHVLLVPDDLVLIANPGMRLHGGPVSALKWIDLQQILKEFSCVDRATFENFGVHIEFVVKCCLLDFIVSLSLARQVTSQ